MARGRAWLPLLWGIGLGVSGGSFLWGSSGRAGLVIGDKIVFTMVIPLLSLLACLALSLAILDRDDSPPDR
jgi:hypothetical protein